MTEESWVKVDAPVCRECEQIIQEKFYWINEKDQVMCDDCYTRAHDVDENRAVFEDRGQ